MDPNQVNGSLYGRACIEQVENISTHINILIDAETLERLGATPERPAHMRVMRILCDYNAVREELEQVKRVLQARKDIMDREHQHNLKILEYVNLKKSVAAP